MIGNNWDNLLEEEQKKDYFINLIDFLKEEYKHKIIYPKQNEIFNAFRYTSYEAIKVVILGQDPYHGPRQAEGLSFSVSNDTAMLAVEGENGVGQFHEVRRVALMLLVALVEHGDVVVQCAGIEGPVCGHLEEVHIITQTMYQYSILDLLLSLDLLCVVFT